MRCLNLQRRMNQIKAENNKISNPKRTVIKDMPYPMATIAGEMSLAREIASIARYRPWKWPKNPIKTLIPPQNKIELIPLSNFA